MAIKKYKYTRITGPTDVDGNYINFAVVPNEPPNASVATENVKGIVSSHHVCGGGESGFVVEKWDGTIIEVNGRHIETAESVEDE